MKNLFILIGLVVSLFSEAQAADNCSIGLAKKFADGIIAVDVKENSSVFKTGKVVYRKSDSQEYTLDSLTEKINLMGEKSAGEYLALKEELEAQPDLHIYRLKFTWDADNNINLGFYYFVYLKNYERGCTLAKVIAD